jgi:hypothetical protein
MAIATERYLLNLCFAAGLAMQTCRAPVSVA